MSEETAGYQVGKNPLLKDVDLTQEAERDAGFRFLRETLEKLYWVFRVHDASGWDTAASTENLEG